MNDTADVGARTLASGSRFRVGFHIPFIFLRASYRRLLLTIVGLASGVALVAAIDLVNRAVLRSFTEVIEAMAGRAALQITTDEGGFFEEATVTAVERIPGVRLAVPVVASTAFTLARPSQALVIHAFDVTNDQARAVYEPEEDNPLEIADPLLFLNSRDSIMLTREFAESNHIQQDDKLELDTPSGRRVFTVRAIIEPKGIAKAYGGKLVVMDIMAAQAAFARPGLVNRIDVVLEPGIDPQQARDQLARALPVGLRIDTPAQRKADIHSVIESVQALLQALGLVALAAAFIIAFNRLSAVFDERVWQLGVFHAIGVRASAIRRELLKESLLIGAAGAVLGVALGVGLARVLMPILAETTALNSRLVAPPGAITLSVSSILLASLLGVGTAVLAAWRPATRVARLTAAESLRSRGIEVEYDDTDLTLIVRVGLLIALCTALALQSTTRGAVWGAIATVLIVALTKSFSRPILDLLTKSLLAPLAKATGPTTRFLSLIVGYNPRRTALTIAMVAVGLGTVVWLATVAYSFEATAIQVFSQAIRADLVVSSTHVGASSLETPVDERFGSDIRDTPGVRSVVGVKVTNWEHAGGPVVLDAFDPAYFLDAEFGQWPLLGRHAPDVWKDVAAGRSVVVSSSFSQNLHVDVGDHVELHTPSGVLGVDVAGITTDFASPRGTIEMSRELYARYWNDPLVTRFLVEVEPDEDLADVAASLPARLVDSGVSWQIITSAELIGHWKAQIQRAFVSLYLLAGVVLVVILFGLADNLGATIGERTREFGVLRAIGLRRRRVISLVVGEAVLISVLGSLLACAQGFAMAMLWISGTIPILLGWVVDLHVPTLPLIGIFAVAFSCCTAAAVLPAHRAAQMEPSAALREE